MNAIAKSQPSTDVAIANASVAALESALLQLPQVDLEASHVIHGGMCARTIFIPAGVALTGALLNHDNICICFGDVSVTTDGEPKRLTGFNVIAASKGRKRAGVAYSDTWWTMVWKTDLVDIRAIESELTDEADLLQTRNTKLLEAVA